MNRWYYYLHSNGELIGKPPLAVESNPFYFDSPNVQRWWRVDLADRISGWRFLIEALASGADPRAVLKIAETWNCTIHDLHRYLSAEHRANGVNDERREGLAMLFTAWEIDADTYLHALAEEGPNAAVKAVGR